MIKTESSIEKPKARTTCYSTETKTEPSAQNGSKTTKYFTK